MKILLPWPPSVPGTYRILDAASGRFYIGSAANLRRRWENHLYSLRRGKHTNPALQAIWDKRGDLLCFEVVEELAGATKAERLAAEQALLDKARVGLNRACLNILHIAGSHEGAKRSKATCEKLRAAMLGRTFSNETRAKMCAAKLGKKQDPETARRSGEARRGKPIKRPHGIINHALRSLTPEKLLELRALRDEGKSWRQLALIASMSTAPLRRAVLGVTYREVA